jgi:predicted dehydrogenase
MQNEVYVKERQMSRTPEFQPGRRGFLQGTALGLAGAVTASAQPVAGSKPLRVGVVGVGWRGTHLANVITRMAQEGEPVEVAALCDIYQPRLERAETRFKTRGFKSSADMLREVQPDVVVVATPDRHHMYDLREAIRAGKDVYCEKPVSHWAQFDLLKSVVHENRKLGRIVQVGTQYVSDSVWERCGELIRQGRIGKPVHAQTSYFRKGDFGEAGMPIDDPDAKPGLGVDWDKFQADAPRHEFSVSRLFQWRLYLDYSGGPATDVYPHNVTPLFKALGPGLPSKVAALGGRYFYTGPREVPDTFDILIQYPQGLTVAVLGSQVNATPIDSVIRGDDASMIKTPDGINIVPQRNVTFAADYKLVVQPERPTTKVPADVVPPGIKPGFDFQTTMHLKDFLDCVRTRKQPRGNLELAYTVQVPMIMAMRSHMEGKIALFDLDREEIRMA